MTEQSRLDAAQSKQADGGGEWFRSPLALVAGLILFLGVLALIVLGLTSGDDTAKSPVGAATRGCCPGGRSACHSVRRCGDSRGRCGHIGR